MTPTRLARIIAFYLPQFHPIPENDQWWGEGFTEWTNVKKAAPLFKGHIQPRVPGTLGYYDLRNPAVRQAQAKMARDHGIEAFCYWHYWFGNGRRILERPFNEVLASGEPDFPFCLCWANESWTGIWHGAPKHILLEQTYPGTADERHHFDTLLPAFLDSRYVKIDGKPLFAIYRPEKLPNSSQFVRHWQQMARDAGFPGLFLIAMSNKPAAPYLKPFDAVLNHAPGDFLAHVISRNVLPRLIRRLLHGRPADFLPRWLRNYIRHPLRFPYADMVKHTLPEIINGERFLPCVLAGWDNTPRSKHRGLVLENFSAPLFRQHLKKALHRVVQNPPEKRLIFIKAWNEWAEGNFLEPDQDMGTILLDVVREVSEQQ